MERLTSTRDFFREVITAAMATHSVRVQEATEYYLVNLLAEHTVAQVGDGDEPLTLKLVQAGAAEPEERTRLLKEIGDTALYRCGFFAESLARRLVSVEYYIGLGGSAYAQLARAGRSVSALFQSVYGELAERFPALVEVLFEARGRMNLNTSTNVLRLYEQWRHTRSDFLARRLRAAGLILPAPHEAS